MKRMAKILALVSVSLVLLFNLVSAQTINDVYVGGEKLPAWDNSYDVIGDKNVFGISKVEVSTDETGYIFDIYTPFASHVGNPEAYDIELGDLFISTNGWAPFGTLPYRQDTATGDTKGETWEYALVLDDHSGDATSGLWNLYSVNDNNIILSNQAMAAYTGVSYRKNQEVQYNGAAQEALATGSWSLFGDYLRFEIAGDLFGANAPLALTDGNEYGFHWTMTCANDVIEGSFEPVPEPATMFLLGSGLVGLGAIRRKKKIA